MIFTEKNLPVMALAPDADRYNTDPATDVVSLAKYEHATFILFEGAGGTGTVKIEVEECTAADGSGNTAIPFRYRLCETGDTWGALTAAAATGYTTVAGANKMVAVEIDGDELSEGSPWVRLQLTEVANDPCDAAVAVIMSGPRYAEDVLPTAIA